MLAILAESGRETETPPAKVGARRREPQRPVCELSLRGLELLSILNEVFDGSPVRVKNEDAADDSGRE